MAKFTSTESENRETNSVEDYVSEDEEPIVWICEFFLFCKNTFYFVLYDAINYEKCMYFYYIVYRVFQTKYDRPTTL